MSISGLGSSKSYIQSTNKSVVDAGKTTEQSEDTQLDLLVKNSTSYVAESFSETEPKAQIYKCFDNLDSIVDQMDDSKISDKQAVKDFLKESIFIEMPHPSGFGKARGIKNSDLNAAKKMIDVLNDSGKKVNVSWSEFLETSYIPKVAERAVKGESCNISLQEILADYEAVVEKKSNNNAILKNYLKKSTATNEIQSSQKEKKHSDVKNLNASAVSSDTDQLKQKLNTTIDTIDSFFDKDSLKLNNLSTGEKSQLLTKVGQLVKELKPDSSGTLSRSFADNFVQQQRINKLETIFKANIVETVDDQFKDFKFAIDSKNDLAAELFSRTLHLKSIEVNIALMEVNEEEQKKLEEKLESLKNFNDQINKLAEEMQKGVQANAKGLITYGKDTITTKVNALSLENPSLKDNAIAYLNQKFDNTNLRLDNSVVPKVVAVEEIETTEVIDADEMLKKFEELFKEKVELTSEQIEFIDSFISKGISEENFKKMVDLIHSNFNTIKSSVNKAPRNMDQLKQNKEMQKSLDKVAHVARIIIAKLPNIANSDKFSFMAKFAANFSHSTTQIEQQLTDHSTLFAEDKDSDLCSKQKSLPVLEDDGSLSKSVVYPSDLQKSSLQRFEKSLGDFSSIEKSIRSEEGFPENLGLLYDSSIAKLEESLAKVNTFFSDEETTNLKTKLTLTITRLTDLKSEYSTTMLQNKWEAAQQKISQANSFDDLLAVHSKYSSDSDINGPNFNEKISEKLEILCQQRQEELELDDISSLTSIGDLSTDINVAKEFFNDKERQLILAWNQQVIGDCSNFDELKTVSGTIDSIDGEYDKAVIDSRNKKFNELITKRSSELGVTSLDDLNLKLYTIAGSSITFDDQCDIAKEFFDNIDEKRKNDNRNASALKIQKITRGKIARDSVKQIKMEAKKLSVVDDSALPNFEYKKFSDCKTLEELKSASFGPKGADRPVTAGNSKAFNSKVFELCNVISRAALHSILYSTKMSYAQKCDSLQKIIDAGGEVNQKRVSSLDLNPKTIEPIKPQRDLNPRLGHPQSISNTVSMNFLDGTEDLSGLSDKQIQNLQNLDNELADNFRTRVHKNKCYITSSITFYFIFNKDVLCSEM